MFHLEDAIANGVISPDEKEGRVYGWIAGVVTDIDTKLMRVRARIGKQEDNDSTDWLVPMGMGSIESLPEVNDPVGVYFQDGDPHRGAYFYFPQSSTNNRPTSEPIPLGMTWAGMYNDLATKLQSAITVINQLVVDVGVLTTLVNTTGLAVASAIAKAVPPISQTSSADNDTIGKVKASDGSVVAPKSGDNVALSKRSKVR